MRHRKNTFKLNRNTSHRRCMLANMLKNLVNEERIETTITKAKFVKRSADKLVTLAKKGDLASRRKVIAQLMIRFNKLNSKDARKLKNGNESVANNDRKIVNKLFDTLGTRFNERQGGYTRIVRTRRRVGDNAEMCFLEYLPE
jgi:large subunit ribosomal protein L17